MKKTAESPDFRSLIEARRAALGLSVNALALKAGVPQRNLADWLHGKNKNIYSGHVQRLFAALDIRVR